MTLRVDPGPAEAGEAVGGPDEGHLGPGRLVPRGPVAVQLGANVAELRRAAGFSTSELAGRAGISQTEVASLEAGHHPPGILVALGLAGSLGVSVDRLALGVFWNPGEPAGGGGPAGDPRRPMFEGYFSTRPAHLREEASARIAVGGQAEVAAVIGRLLRDARRRRRIPQHGLGPKQSHVSRIERGLQEANLETVIALARRLELAPEALLAGLRWGGRGPARAWAEATGRGGRPRDPRSLDPVVLGRSRAGAGPGEIAQEIGVGEEVVRRVLRRLRAEGRSLDPDPAGWTAADVEDELALRALDAARRSEKVTPEEVAEIIGRTVRGLRDLAEMSQGRLAEACGFMSGATTVSRIEHGRSNISVTYLIRLAASLGVPCSTLVGGLGWDPRARSFVLGGRRPAPPAPAARIGDNARRLRQEARLTERTVALRVGRRGRFFDAIERGVKLPRPVTLLMLACALEVEVGALLEGVCDWYVRPLPPPAMPESEEAAESAARQARLLRLWSDGADLRSIGEAVDMKPKTVFAQVDRLREVGVGVPYRKAPADRAQLSGRLRRLRAGRPQGLLRDAA